MRERWSRRIAVVAALAVITAFGVPRAASTSPDPHPAPPADLEAAQAAAAARYFRELKRTQLDLLHDGARARFARMRSQRSQRSVGADARPRRSGMRPPRPLEVDLQSATRRALSPARRVAERALEPDVRINDRYSDVTPSSTQSEVSIASNGLDQVAAWNDAEWRFQAGPMGFATSRDGGRTWTDRGAPPVGGRVTGWVSDPVVAVDEKRGAFYLVGMAVATVGDGPAPLLASAIAMTRGAFSDTGFTWETPVAVRVTRDTLPDKPWIAADSANGNLYVTYTTFMQKNGAQSDRIDFQRSTDGGLTWSVPVRLSSEEDEGLVQGSRPAAGVDGIVDVVWSAVDTSLASGGLDYRRFRRSRDGGATFGPQSTAAELYANFASGAPGFNRGRSIDFPGIAEDRSAGPHRGRVYVIWQEGLDYYDDYPTGDVPVIDTDDVTATPFEIGMMVRGHLDRSPPDVDLLRFSGSAGQSVIFYVDSLDASLEMALRLYCSDGISRMALHAATRRGRPSGLVCTLPETGEYFLSVTLYGRPTGGYRIRTGLVAPGEERARDHRDVFISHSDDGIHWSEPRRVNDDEPRFDDWLPEVAVSPRGAVYAAWYDWRDSPPEACGTWSRVRLSRSDDGGESWVPLGTFADVATAWSDVGSNLAPNQGDYIALIADERAVRIAWADGRDGDPDIYTAAHPLALDPLPIVRGAPPRLAGIHPNPARRTIHVEAALGSAAPVSAELIDTSGRRRRSFTVNPGAGLRRFELDLGTGLPGGVYFLRLTQQGAASVARVAVIP